MFLKWAPQVPLETFSRHARNRDLPRVNLFHSVTSVAPCLNMEKGVLYVSKECTRKASPRVSWLVRAKIDLNVVSPAAISLNVAFVALCARYVLGGHDSRFTFSLPKKPLDLAWKRCFVFANRSLLSSSCDEDSILVCAFLPSL
jgi:hypothetical protein